MCIRDSLSAGGADRADCRWGDPAGGAGAAGQSAGVRRPDGRSHLCLLYTSDAADERSSVDLGGRRIIKKKTISTEVCDRSTVKQELC